MARRKSKRLGDLLLDAGLINMQQMEHILVLQRQNGKKIGEIIVEEGYAEEKDIIEILKIQMGILHVNLEKQQIDAEVPKLIPENMARRHSLIPFKIERGRLFVAMADPLNIVAIDDVKIYTGMEVEPIITTRQEILKAIDQFYRKQSTEQAMEEFKKQFDLEDTTKKEVDEETFLKVNSAPLVKFVDSLIKQAISAKASDIHIEPFEKHVRVRFRVDGDLQEVITPEKTSHSAIVTRIKIMGKMDIAEKRVPQDGRVNYTIGGRNVDMRISVLPTAYGEKVVIRLLDNSDMALTKEDLGFGERDLQVFSNLLLYPNGIILVTGPTGSGKTTTLYAILRELNKINKNIITVEDPVEYRMDGVNQVQVNTKAGLTFASGLRSILRQDPDIIMIGEIRDAETAQIAVRAAITGHLVLSTMHTNDTASTVTRLVDMGINPYLISSAVVGVIAQRLVKKICKECKISYLGELPHKKLMSFPEDQDLVLFKGEGCPACNGTGYKGRTTIVEIMPINRPIKELIDKECHVEVIRKKALDEGMIPLRKNAVELVLRGVTTIDELIRNTYTIE